MVGEGGRREDDGKGEDHEFRGRDLPSAENPARELWFKCYPDRVRCLEGPGISESAVGFRLVGRNLFLTRQVAQTKFILRIVPPVDPDTNASFCSL